MNDILQRYGIKEVADVTFYEIENNGQPGAPVLVLDSLKVTTISQTASSAEARGGKGNPKLIVWDYGKELSVEIEDALFSPKSFAIMFANGYVADGNTSGVTEAGYIRKSARVTATTTVPSNQVIKIDDKTVSPTENTIVWYDGTGASVTSLTEGMVYFATWMQPVSQKSVITITPDSFPGTYYVTGDTMVRSDTTGKDEYFQFVIPKAKMQAEQTVTMQADGDPSTFNMSLQILRPADGEMVKFIKYDFAYGGDLTETPYVTEVKTEGTEASNDGWKSAIKN